MQTRVNGNVSSITSSNQAYAKHKQALTTVHQINQDEQK